MASTVGDRIREARLARGWTQSRLAEGLPLSASYLSLVERGRRRPSRRVVELLAERLGCDTEFLRTGRGGPEGDAVRLELQFAELALRSGDVAVARGCFGDALALAGRAGDDDARHEALWGLSRAQYADGDLDESLRGLVELAEAAELPEAVSRTAVTTMRCRTHLELGEHTRAIALGEAGLAEEAAGGGGDCRDDVAELASTLVLCYYERGDLTRAHLLARRVIERAEQAGSPRARAAAYWNAALVVEARGDLAEARQFTERALGLYAESDHPWAVAALRVNAAWLLLRMPRADHDEAARLLDRALTDLAELGSPVDVASAQTELARCCLLAGRPAEALDAANAALETLGGGVHIEAARAHTLAAAAFLAMGDAPAALDSYGKASGELDLVGGTRQTAEIWRELADVLLALDRPEEALVAYRRVADAAGVPTGPPMPWRAAGAAAGRRP